MKNDPVKEVFYGLCKRTDTPYSLGLWLRYCHAPHELAAATIDPLAYDNHNSFMLDYQCLAYLRKYEALNTGIDKRRVALDSFAAAELACAETNRRLTSYPQTCIGEPMLQAYITRMQTYLERLWGEPSFDDLFYGCGWGPGSTASLKGANANTEAKMQFPIEVTPGALPYLKAVIKADHHWLAVAFESCRCSTSGDPAAAFTLTSTSRLLTVPKDSTKDRTIAAEPTGNIFLQKGIGYYLRRRLAGTGVNLDDQSRNQRLASIAHKAGLATLDMRAASDTVSIQVVKLLLPFSAYSIISRLRTPSTILKAEKRGQQDHTIKLHKFSSMGNGFTFELESAIFWAATKAVRDERGTQGDIGIYGDDIICPQTDATELIRLLAYLGFETNTTKSFTAGRFFESCGKHYFDGIDVTPFFQKKTPKDDPLEYIRFTNRVYLMDSKLPMADIADRLRRDSPRIIQRCVGPDWLEGDGFFYIEPQKFVGLVRAYGRSIKVKVAQAPETKQVWGDCGNYAYYMRRLGCPLVKGQQEGMQTRSFSDTLSAKLGIIDTTGLAGILDFRSTSRVKRVFLTHRWVSMSFGEDLTSPSRTLRSDRI